MPTLLAVDCGLRCGLALYGDDGHLRWVQSRHIGSAARLRQAAPAFLAGAPEVALLVVEGGGPLARIWQRAAERMGIPVRLISAETWRSDLLTDREQRSGSQAKRSADFLARLIIEWSGHVQPKALRSDAAEAVLIGLWGVIATGWLHHLPDAVRKSWESRVSS